VLERPGVRPTTGRLDDLPWLDGDAVDDEREASRTLDWVRGGR
jgi:hypothetical protein